jgi:hypothetical protein
MRDIVQKELQEGNQKKSNGADAQMDFSFPDANDNQKQRVRTPQDAE